MEQQRVKLLAMPHLSNDKRSFFAFQKEIYVWESSNKPFRGFYLLHRVTKEMLGLASGVDTPTAIEADSLSDISEVVFPAKTAKEVVLKMRKEKLNRMREIGKVQNAICRISDTSLLARFKAGDELKRVLAAKKPSQMDESEVARIMVQTFLAMRAELKAAKMKVEELEWEKQKETLAKQKAVHTPENASGPAMRLVIEGEEETEEQAAGESAGEGEGEDEEVQPPPAKQRKLEGHRVPVPIEIQLPADFETWPKSKQIHKVSQLRMKFLRPEQFHKQTKRSSVRSRMCKKKSTIKKMKAQIRELRKSISDAQVGGRHALAREKGRQLQNKLSKRALYKSQVRQYLRTRSRAVEGTKHSDLSETEDEEEGVQVVGQVVQEEDVAAAESDTVPVRILKDKLARQATMYEASAKAMQDFMSLSLDERRKWQESTNKELESLREELRHTRGLLENQKPAHEVVDQVFVNLFPRDMTNREEFIEGIEDDLKKSLDQNCETVQERTVEDRKKEMEKIRAEYEEKAKQMHQITKKRETFLCERIAQLMRELRKEKEVSKELSAMNGTLRNMLIFPNHVSKAEVMMWKVLMAQWRRITLGFPYDPEDHMDIQWDEEFSSDDYDSEDLHSEPRSDDSPAESTTEEEDNNEEQAPAAEDKLAPLTTQEAPGGDLEQQGAPIPETASGDAQRATKPAASVVSAASSSDSDELEWSSYESEQFSDSSSTEGNSSDAEQSDKATMDLLDTTKSSTPSTDVSASQSKDSTPKRVSLQSVPLPEATVEEQRGVAKDAPGAVEDDGSTEESSSAPSSTDDSGDESEPETPNALHHRHKSAPDHPMEGRILLSDMSVLEYMGVRAKQYNVEVTKEMRDFIEMDDPTVYGKREKREITRMMWGDIPNITYNFRWCNNIAPMSMPVCKTYEEAVAQHQKSDNERQLLVDENVALLDQFGEEEAERRMKELDGPALEAAAKEKEAEKQLELTQRFRPGEAVVERQKCVDPDITAKRRNFVMGCRRKVEEMSREQIRESEQRVERFMKKRFKTYVPLRHHLMAFQEENIMKQYSKSTPEAELSVFNHYTGGEGQTPEQMAGIAKRAVARCADVEEDVGDIV